MKAPGTTSRAKTPQPICPSIIPQTPITIPSYVPLRIQIVQKGLCEFADAFQFPENVNYLFERPP